MKVSRGLFVSCAVLALAVGIAFADPAWNQYGGPNQDFKAASTGLAKSWPDGGPKELWSRDLGEGYSGILVDGDRLYTMYRADEKEIVVALDAKSGKTVWEHGYESSPREGHIDQFGRGPRSTPLLHGDHVYTVGVAAQMHCLKKETGEVVWSHNLWDDFGGNFLNHGYSSSLIAYDGTIIALVGGEGAGIVAFDAKSGEVEWQNQDFKNSYSTPRILNVDGEEQLVTFMASEMIGVDPNNGELKWSYPHENQWQQNINMPVMADKNTLFLSAPQAGARGLKLTNADGKTEVEEIWSSRKIQFYHVSSVRDGDWVYGSTGIMAPAFMAAVNIRTGEIGWRHRGIPKANVLQADGRLIILDEDGSLYLATASPEELQVHSQIQLFDKSAWTVPTVVGKTVFVRDQSRIAALDLG